MKKISILLICSQLLAEDKTFAGQPVQERENESFALVSIAGEITKVNTGDWLVEYPDGTKEVWTDKKMQDSTAEEEIAKPEPEPIEIAKPEKLSPL